MSNSKSAKYLVTLQGGGDFYAALVDQETFNWINRDDTPGRKGRETGWTDSAAPDWLKKMETILVTSGSYQNDRAIYAVMNGGVTYNSALEAFTDAKQHQWEIVDEWDGVMY